MSSVVESFHDLYWNSGAWNWTFWRGIPALKCPLDLWVYQEILWLSRPRLVVELGTWAGGTANFLADLMDLYDADPESRVLTIDILDDAGMAPNVSSYRDRVPFQVRIRPPHRRVEYFTADSVSATAVDYVHAAAAGRGPIMVIADSNHSFEHTYQELCLYHDVVTPGSWFIMEDTDGPGPRRAVDLFLENHPEFTADAQCEKFHMTFNPRGYLKKRA